MTGTQKPVNRGPAPVREVADRMRAQLALGDDPAFHWLCHRGDGGRPISWKPAILGELGRLQSDQGTEKMLALARELCESQPSEEEAIRSVRVQRLKGSSQEMLHLSEAIVRTVETFLVEHPKTQHETVVEALEDARACLLKRME